MNSVKRYNLAQNAAFNSARTTADRRAYRAIMRQFPGVLGDMERAYLADLLRHGNKAASFPSFKDWAASLQQGGAL